MNLVRDCMFPDITTLSPTTTLLEAMRRITRQPSGFAVILDNMILVGLVTEFDFIRWLVKGYEIEQVRFRDLQLSVPQTVHENTPCQALLHIYNHRRFRRFPVLNDDELLSGGITEKQILKSFPLSNLMVHYQVTDSLVSKPPEISADLTFFDVAHRMVQWHRGCVLVTEKEQLLGMVTEGDLLRFRLSPQWSPDTLVGQWPMSKPLTIEPDRSLLYATNLFIQSGHRRLPVVAKDAKKNQGSTLVGLLTQTDILKQVVDSVRSHKAILNPEDINEPAIWFEPDDTHRILALNEKGAKTLELDPTIWVGRSVHDLAIDPSVWGAISVLLQSCGTIDRINLPLRSGEGNGICASCHFSLVHTPTGKDRIFWTIVGMENGRVNCN